MEKKLKQDLKTLRDFISDYNILSPKIKAIAKKSVNNYFSAQHNIVGAGRDASELIKLTEPNRQNFNPYQYSVDKGWFEGTLEEWVKDKKTLRDKIETVSDCLISSDDSLDYLSDL